MMQNGPVQTSDLLLFLIFSILHLVSELFRANPEPGAVVEPEIFHTLIALE